MHSRLGNQAAIDPDPARTLALDPRGDAKRRGLAAAGRTQQANDFARTDVEVQVADHRDTVEFDRDPFERQAWRRRGVGYLGRCIAFPIGLVTRQSDNS